MNKIAQCTTDATGLIVTQVSGTQFAPSWVGLQILINGNLSVIASVDSLKQLHLATAVPQFSTPVPLAPNRETIYQALFNLVKQAPGLLLATRVPQVWTNVDPAQKPYLYMEQSGEVALNPGKGMPYNWQFDVLIGVMTYSSDPLSIVPASLLNPIIDSIAAMLEPSPTTGQGNTLDGLVNEVRLINNGKEAAGAIATDAFAIMPVRISTL